MADELFQTLLQKAQTMGPTPPWDIEENWKLGEMPIGPNAPMTIEPSLIQNLGKVGANLNKSKPIAAVMEMLESFINKPATLPKESLDRAALGSRVTSHIPPRRPYLNPGAGFTFRNEPRFRPSRAPGIEEQRSLYTRTMNRVKNAMNPDPVRVKSASDLDRASLIQKGHGQVKTYSPQEIEAMNKPIMEKNANVLPQGRGPGYTLSPAMKEKILSTYQTGQLTRAQVAKRFGIGEATVTRVLRESGMKTPGKGWRRAVDYDAVVEALREGNKQVDVAKRFGVSRGHISRILKQASEVKTKMGK